jgi:hypothetical protein
VDAHFRLETAELNGQTRSVRILMNDEARHSWGSWDTAPYHMENPNSVVYPNHPIEVWGNVIYPWCGWDLFPRMTYQFFRNVFLSSFPQQIGVFRSWEGPQNGNFLQAELRQTIGSPLSQVCLDWEPLETLRTRVSATVMSAAQYAAACDRGIAGSTAWGWRKCRHVLVPPVAMAL